MDEVCLFIEAVFSPSRKFFETAIRQGYAKVFDYLIKIINPIDEDLDLAIEYQQYSFVDALLTADSLKRAAQRGNLTTVQYLVKRNLFIDSGIYQVATPEIKHYLLSLKGFYGQMGIFKTTVNKIANDNRTITMGYGVDRRGVVTWKTIESMTSPETYGVVITDVMSVGLKKYCISKGCLIFESKVITKIPLKMGQQILVQLSVKRTAAGTIRGICFKLFDPL